MVLLVNFSLSPAIGFPVALEECYSNVAYVSSHERAKNLNIDSTRVAIGSDSAGANIWLLVLIVI